MWIEDCDLTLFFFFRLYPDNPQLSDPKGSLVSVLFAFIAMVPDLKYHRGMCLCV